MSSKWDFHLQEVRVGKVKSVFNKTEEEKVCCPQRDFFRLTFTKIEERVIDGWTLESENERYLCRRQRQLF